MNSTCDNPTERTRFGIAPVISSGAFLGYIALVIVNIPPFVRSDHVSVNWNMLFIAGFGAIGSASALAAVAFPRVTKQIGRMPATIIGVEAVLILIFSIYLLYRSFVFFGIV